MEATVATGKLKEGCTLLGDVHFQSLESGRVHCLETGHEMPQAQKAFYHGSKKCHLVLFDMALDQCMTPLNFFEQSPVANSKDTVICTLTRDTINKSEEVVWKHMNGKKFHYKLGKLAEEVLQIPPS